MRTVLTRYGSPVEAVLGGGSVWLRSRHGMLRMARSPAVLALLTEPEGWATAPEELRRALSARGVSPHDAGVTGDGRRGIAVARADAASACAYPLSVPEVAHAAGVPGTPVALAADARPAVGGPAVGGPAVDGPAVDGPWLVYLHAGHNVLVGLLPGPRPCPRCIADRLRATYPFGQAALGAALADLFDPPQRHADAAHRHCPAAYRLLRATLAAAAREPGGLLEARFEGGRARVRPRPAPPTPGCPRCRPADRTPRAGAHRASRTGTAAASHRFQELVDTRTGVVAGVEVLPYGRVFAARTRTRLDTRVFSPVRAFAGGAAVKPDPARATVAALGEAYERYAAGVVRPGLVRRASLVELAGEAVDPRNLVDPDPAADRAADPAADTAADPAADRAAGTAADPADPGRARFDPRRPVGWVRAVAPDGAVRLVPAAAVYLPFPEPALRRVVRQTSLGLAAGTTPGDARRRAATELVERIAWQRAWRTRTIRRRLAPGACCEDMARLLDSATAGNAAGGGAAGGALEDGAGGALEDGAGGARVWAADISVVPAIPVVLAGAVSFGGVGGERSGRSRVPVVALGLGAAGTVHQALLHALGEVIQSRIHLAEVLGRRPVPARPARVRDADDRYAFYCHPDRLPRLGFLWAGGDGVPVAHEPDRGGADPFAALAALGVRPWTVDLTPDDLGAAGVFVARVLLEAVTPVRAAGPRPGADPIPPGWPPPGC